MENLQRLINHEAKVHKLIMETIFKVADACAHCGIDVHNEPKMLNGRPYHEVCFSNHCQHKDVIGFECQTCYKDFS